MSAPSAAAVLKTQCVTGVRDPSSLGVARYCGRLAQALQSVGVDYELSERVSPGRSAHLHLANSSRRSILEAQRTSRFVVTLHDVLPRTRAFVPFYRAFVYPRVVSRADAVVVHSRAARDLLADLGVDTARTVVIPHPAARPSSSDRAAARAALGLTAERRVAVLPGVIKGAKLAREAFAAAAELRDEWLLVLAGRVRDRTLHEAARRVGALVLEAPDDATYEHAIVAADAVLCVRRASVGETNGPLLDALGAGRAVVATSTGSIPEVAGDAAVYVEPSASGIADGLRKLADLSVRQRLEAAAAKQGSELTWERAALAHRDLFTEVFGG